MPDNKSSATMRAAIYTQYGPPEVVQVESVATPTPASDEVLIKIHATTVNRTDCGFRSAEYFIIRLFHGLFKPKKHILGSEFAGTVAAVGPAVKTFKPGDPVFGLSTYRFGTHAEYICIPESKSIAAKPSNMNYDAAAAVCDGLMLGMNFIKNVDFNQKQKILINGASGSIGSACVQLARYYGADITAVCNTQTAALVRSLGAREVIDYTKEDFTACGQQFDFIFDTVGKSSFFKCKKILKPGGIYISSELGYLMQNVFLPLWTGISGGKKVKFPIPTDSKADIVFFKELIEAGHYQAVIDRQYSLEQIVEAYQYVETGQKTGNVVVVLEQVPTRDLNKIRSPLDNMDF